ncbi:hypothetical protein PCANC_01752 [Puccinia coronata f. sp. avenae]|uniref:Uncharacterized protein n=1 Tax=Puccinia coronata f. sp. avenae TaxID=200324 RepID=A0A2N5W564_9BASI|nr:hypothetical protein PCANC_01752 [Puccinia coronata f. sp. avenae]
MKINGIARITVLFSILISLGVCVEIIRIERTEWTLDSTTPWTGPPSLLARDPPPPSPIKLAWGGPQIVRPADRRHLLFPVGIDDLFHLYSGQKPTELYLHNEGQYPLVYHVRDEAKLSWLEKTIVGGDIHIIESFEVAVWIRDLTKREVDELNDAPSQASYN